MKSVQHLIAQNLATLDQALALIDRLDDDSFRAVGPGFENGSIGTQLRHCIDYYECFLDGLGSGEVDYDQRHRDERVERDRDFAAERIRAIGRRLGALEDALLTVQVDQPEGTPSFKSHGSIGRELQFLNSHVVHHFALIAFILGALELSVESDFGVATSTLRHWAGAP
jgi:hypothetical protein